SDYETYLEDQEAKRPKVEHNSIELEDQNVKHSKVKHNSIKNECRKILYSNLKNEKVNELFFKWGGISRFVLKKANDQTQQDKLENAIVRCDEKIFYYIGENESRDDISHKLIHISINPPEENDVDYKNPYTKKALNLHQNSKSNQFIGNFFEQIAYRILQRRGEFKIRSLDSNESNTLKLNQQNEIFVFSSVNTISNAKYFQPSSKNFPSIDAIIVLDKLFQITTAWEHPIKTIGITKLRSKLSKKGYISLFFVVLANLYNDYKKQRFKSEQEIKNHIKQYALKIDLSSTRH
ncbi:36501_t:CDS:2, partial [Gigaspora margarita]